jgi:hypothetical protein
MHFRRRRPRRRAAAPSRYPVRAILDFGASGARAVIARVSSEGAEILGAAEVTGRTGMARPGQAMRHEQISTLADRALSAAEWDTAREGELPSIADDAVVGLAGPLLEAESEVWHRRRDNPIAPVYRDEILHALEAAQRRNLARLSEQVAASRIRRSLVASQLIGALSLREDTRQAERLPNIMRGVPGQSGDYLSIAICNLTWPAKGLEILKRVIEDLELNLLGVTPMAQAIAAAIPVPDAILIDIGQEHTEISLAEGGALSNLASITMGGHAFTHALTRYLHLSEKHAELVKQQHTRGQGIPEGSPVPRILARTAQSWHRAVEQTLLQLAGDAPLPSHIYLFGGGAPLPEIMEQLRAQPWMQRLPFDRHPKVERLMPQHLRGLHDPRGLLVASSQVGLAALAVWASHEPTPLQRRLARISSDLAPQFGLASG